MVPRLKIMDVTAKNGVPFRVTYGHREYLNGEFSKFPVVSFYDLRYSHTENGQFISDYSALSIVYRDFCGLDLCGGVESWIVDRLTMQLISIWVVYLLANG